MRALSALYPRHCERTEAIHRAAKGKMDCFVALLLAMTAWRGARAIPDPMTTMAAAIANRPRALSTIHARIIRALSASLRAQRSNPSCRERKDGLLRRFAPRNDGMGRRTRYPRHCEERLRRRNPSSLYGTIRILAAQKRPKGWVRRASANRGRREDRVRAAPAVSCAMGRVEWRTRAYRFSGEHPAFPAQ